MAGRKSGRNLRVNSPSTLTTPYRPLVLVAVAACLGVACDRVFVSSTSYAGAAGWPAAAVVALAAWASFHQRRHERAAAVAVLAAIACTFGAWHHLRWHYVERDNLGRMAGETPQPACLELVVTGPVEKIAAPRSTPLRATAARAACQADVRVVAIRDGAAWRWASGCSRLRIAGEAPEINVGDRLRVFAAIALPYPALNPGQYDWAEAQRGQRRFVQIFCTDPSCVTTLSSAAPGWSGILTRARVWCRRQLADRLGPEHADLGLAVLVGDRQRLGDSTKQAFLLSGAIHLLVVSGLHVGMLAAAVWSALRIARVPRTAALTLTALAVVLYAAVTGLRPPVVRASLLTLLMLFAMGAGRKFSPVQLLAAAALVVLAVNPSELFRSGTQLSFLSVLVLVRFGQYLNRKVEQDPLQRLIAESRPWPQQSARGLATRATHLAAASLIVWLITAPLVAHHFHLSTPGGILVSPIIWPLVAAAIAAGAGAVAVGWAIPPLGSLLGAVCGSCLHATHGVVQYAQSFRVGHCYLPGPSAWWLIVFYAALMLATAFPRWRPPLRGQVALVVVWIAVGLIQIGGLRRENPALRCTFLAMGHGTCAVLEMPGGQTLLYDAGSLGSPEAAGRTIASFLWSRQISHIDAIVVSHADIDHYNAVPTLLERFSVGALYVSPMMFDGVAGAQPDPAAELLEQTATSFGVPRVEVDKNDALKTADPRIEIRVLHPPPAGVDGRDNANSLVLAIEYGGRRILLPGDLESPGLEQLTSGPPLDADVLLAPHHGSAGSDPPGFAAWCRPEWVVVSGARGSRTEVATRTYQQAGAQVLNTSDRGAAEFSISPGGIRARTYR